MNTLPYTIWRKDFLTMEGTGEQWDVGIAAKAKIHADNPLEVAHELLALRLGLIIGLPMPVGAPLFDDAEPDKVWWGSLTLGRESITDKASRADIAAILADQRTACGIIVFDSWILNRDRFPKNIAYDDESQQTYIFDHGRAFGAGHLGDLEKNRDCIGITGEERHCLAGITSLGYFGEWQGRLLAIPEWYVWESINAAVKHGLTHDFGIAIGNYLLERRVRLWEIFREQRHLYFPRLDEGLFDPFSRPVNRADEIDYFI